ncbi:MAG: protein arginine kinase [Clostridium sp.]|nr:protein arginine kinase [Clostridium sp.]
MKNWILSEVNNDDIVLNSRIRLARNIQEMQFPEKLSFIEGRKNGKMIFDALKEQVPDEDINLYDMWDDSQESFNKYVEEYLISNDLIKNSNKGSFIINKDKTLSIMVNENDHIKIQCINSGFNLKETLDHAIDIDDKIEKSINYAFDEQLGYLTSHISDLGTGMKASVMIHLPALTMNKEIDNIAKDYKKTGIEINGVYLEDNKVIGNLYTISNSFTLGITEEDIINKVKECVINVIKEEKKYREILMSKCTYEIEDKIYRAFGILKSAVLLDYSELLNYLSMVRLGTELSLIDLDKTKLNLLMTSSSDYGIQNNFESSLSPKEIRHERANLVKKILS